MAAAPHGDAAGCGRTNRAALGAQPGNVSESYCGLSLPEPTDPQKLWSLPFNDDRPGRRSWRAERLAWVRSLDAANTAGERVRNFVDGRRAHPILRAVHWGRVPRISLRSLRRLFSDYVVPYYVCVRAAARMGETPHPAGWSWRSGFLMPLRRVLNGHRLYSA